MKECGIMTSRLEQFNATIDKVEKHIKEQEKAIELLATYANALLDKSNHVEYLIKTFDAVVNHPMACRALLRKAQ